jgi:hypothetical protein
MQRRSPALRPIAAATAALKPTHRFALPNIRTLLEERWRCRWRSRRMIWARSRSGRIGWMRHERGGGRRGRTVHTERDSAWKNMRVSSTGKYKWKGRGEKREWHQGMRLLQNVTSQTPHYQHQSQRLWQKSARNRDFRCNWMPIISKVWHSKIVKMGGNASKEE